MLYIGYYRKSPGGNKTDEQLRGSLGIAAQQAAVRAYANGSLLAEYEDMISGEDNNRPELLAALEHAKTAGATLLIAKLDRLSRNMTFISTLIDRGVPFLAVDMPGADELTTHIVGAFAHSERKRIGKRVKDGLIQYVAREREIDPNFKFGKNKHGEYNLTQAARDKGVRVRKEKAASNHNTKPATLTARTLREAGKTLQDIADLLNKNGFKTATGKLFTPTQVSRLIR